jgi:hypothetical protein
MNRRKRPDRGSAAKRRFVDPSLAVARCEAMREPHRARRIVGTGYGYLREDGITVIPIGALGP